MSNEDNRPLWQVQKEAAEHYNRTGCYRAKDVLRILGNPSVGVVLEDGEWKPSKLK